MKESPVWQNEDATLMEIYLLRHGIAANDSPTGRDSDRTLTDEGRSKLRQVLKIVSDGGVRPELIISSPFVRARQTADIAKELLGYKDEIAFSDALVPEADPQDIWQEIRTVHKGSECILLASHEPLMGRCLGYLLGAPELLVDFKKGAIVRVDLESLGVHPRGILRWMLIPKLAAA
jgi:phosphohistidine phosphatase